MIGVAVIGAGIGGQHLDGFRALPGSYSIRAICDLNVERARDRVQEGEDITVTDDYASVLADPSVELVDICLPPHLHFTMTKAALEAGKNVICEKPLVRSLAEADLLEEVIARTGKQVFPVFQYRYGPGTERLKALIDAGLAGKPLVATAQTHWNRGAGYYAVDWRGTWAGESGGAVLGHAIHNHDFISFFMGPVQSLHAMLDTRVNDIEVDDCAAISMRMQNGALVTSSVTLGAATDMTRFRFVFSELTAESDTLPYRPAIGEWHFTARDPDKQPIVDEIVAGFGEASYGFTGFFEAVAEALNGRPGRHVSVADGRRSIELVTAIYQSARSGQLVSLPLAKDAELYGGWVP